MYVEVFSPNLLNNGCVCVCVCDEHGDRVYKPGLCLWTHWRARSCPQTPKPCLFVPSRVITCRFSKSPRALPTRDSRASDETLNWAKGLRYDSLSLSLFSLSCALAHLFACCTSFYHRSPHVRLRAGTENSMEQTKNKYLFRPFIKVLIKTDSILQKDGRRNGGIWF